MTVARVDREHLRAHMFVTKRNRNGADRASRPGQSDNGARDKGASPGPSDDEAKPGPSD